MSVFLISQLLGHAAAMNSQSINMSQLEPSFEHKQDYKYVKTWETKPWACQDRHKTGHRQVLTLGACQPCQLHTLKAATLGWN